MVEDQESLTERVAFVHQRFEQPAIVEEFIVGRELYVSVIGNDEKLELLPLTELVFDKEKNAPEERFATQSAKWDEAYRRRKWGAQSLCRPVSAPRARERIDAIAAPPSTPLLRDYAPHRPPAQDDDEIWMWRPTPIRYQPGSRNRHNADKAGMPYRLHPADRERGDGAPCRRVRSAGSPRRPTIPGACAATGAPWWNYCPDCSRPQRWRDATGHEAVNAPIAAGPLAQVFVLPLV